ncbi:hypothetical protein TNCV_1123051 [Trichonephila clavipes]|uniref:Uncharacterized protein n=1 Tax=Trichonephila clavipes TaxID=2585209 RepID=A0A8X6SKI7_TRICX|nr:hypothetical protein TNCV_1123051 [Trichonephila clavipes]
MRGITQCRFKLIPASGRRSTDPLEPVGSEFITSLRNKGLSPVYPDPGSLDACPKRPMDKPTLGVRYATAFRALEPLKTRRVEELMHVKSAEAQRPPIDGM